MAAGPDASGRRRTDFIDRLRVVLTGLVVAHHTAITYGGSGSWFYREVSDAGRPGSLLLTLFCAVNQSFFMGMFFLLAGYFTPASLHRKGPWRFMADRLIRLGVPLLVFGFVLGPLAVALAGVAQGRPLVAAWTALLRSGSFVIGPLWFAWALLIFAGLWMLRVHGLPGSTGGVPGPGRADRATGALPGRHAWWLSAIGVGAVAWLLRLWVPVGENVLGLQLGYFASYVFLYFLGCQAAAGRWLERVDAAQARRWAWVALLAVPLLPLTAALSGALQGKPVDFNGGWSLPSLVYAFWEPLVAWGIIATLLVQFQRRFPEPGRRWKRWGEEAYGAFVVHAPVIVALSVLLRPWPAPPLAKFCAVTVAGIVLSFGISRALRALPGVARVL